MPKNWIFTFKPRKWNGEPAKTQNYEQNAIKFSVNFHGKQWKHGRKPTTQLGLKKRSVLF